MKNNDYNMYENVFKRKGRQVLGSKTFYEK